MCNALEYNPPGAIKIDFHTSPKTDFDANSSSADGQDLTFVQNDTSAKLPDGTPIIDVWRNLSNALNGQTAYV